MVSFSSEQFLVELIDDLGPLNNKFRVIKDPIEKIRCMWEMGERLDRALTESGAKLHELLLTLYDPHGQKLAYITRDLGSYSYRIYKYFPEKDAINKRLPSLRHYYLFREAIPLLFNEKYKLTESQKNQLLDLIQKSNNPAKTIRYLKSLKRSIQPIKNPRNQLSKQYQTEAAWLSQLKLSINRLYKDSARLPAEDNLPIGKKEREYLVQILMAIAGNTNDRQLDSINEQDVSKPVVDLLRVAKGKSQDKARFKKWALDTRSLMNLAEQLHALDSQQTYSFVRKKLLNRATW